MARNVLIPFRAGPSADPFLSLHRDVNRLFDEVWRGGMSPGGEADQGGSFIPARLNVAETENEFRVSAELPGLSPDQVDVRLEEDLLTIRGEKTFERRDEKENYHLVECAYGTIQRSLRLPFPVDPEQVQASFENGVLTVSLPKSKVQERSRRIEVRGRSNGPPGRESGNGRSGPGSTSREISVERDDGGTHHAPTAEKP